MKIQVDFTGTENCKANKTKGTKTLIIPKEPVKPVTKKRAAGLEMPLGD